MTTWHESPPPSSATPVSDRERYDVGPTAALLGVDLMGWQLQVLERAMELQAGRPAYREINVSTPRQSGKSTLILVVAVHRMLQQPGAWVTYTSAARLAARRKLLRTWWPQIQRSKLKDMFKVSRGAGAEALECTNGSSLIILSGDEASGHGDSIDLAFLDECWSLDESSEQAVRPAMAARPAGQLWCLSTAGTRKSAYWRAKVEEGRTGAQLGVTDGTCFVEWAAKPGIDITDQTRWPSFMPALGRTIQPATVAADMASMRFSEWARAFANRWPDEDDESGWSVISKAAFERTME